MRLHASFVRLEYYVSLLCLAFATNVPTHATPLQQGLVAYWPLDAGTGDQTSDGFGGIADVGQLRNSPDWLTSADAKLGDSALLFDGIEQDVLIPPSADLDIGTNAVSISAWVNLDNLPSEIEESFAGIFDSDSDDYVMYLDRSAQELRFKVTDDDGSAERPGIPESLLSTGDWHHVLGVYDGNAGEAKIYHNGQFTDSHTNADLTSLVRPGQVASIGSNGKPGDLPASRFFAGAIDDFGIWNRPLGLAEASYLYNEGLGTAIGAANPDIVPVPDIAPVTPMKPMVDPVVHLRFDGDLKNSGTGGTAFDGIHLDALDLNDELFTESTSGQALDLRENAISQALDGDAVLVDYVLTDNGSIVFDYTANEYYNFQSLWTNSIEANDWEMWIYGDGRLRGRVDGNSFGEVDLESLSGLDTTYQIAFTWERDENNVSVKLYVDGEKQDQDLVGNWVEPGETVYIGGGDGTNHYGNGIWDEFQIYDSTLSEGELLYLFSGPAIGCDPNSRGDLDGNGKVEFADFLVLSANFGKDVASHEEGDIDCSSTVAFADFLILSAEFGNTIEGSAQVPEPTGSSILIIGAALVGIAIRKRQA